MLIYLVWKLSPRERIPLVFIYLFIFFTCTLQLPISLMTMSITEVLSSFFGMAVPGGSAAEGRGAEPYFLLSYSLESQGYV